MKLDPHQTDLINHQKLLFVRRARFFGVQLRGRGLLEITTLLSGGYRKTNDPEAPTAVKRRRKRRLDATAAKKATVAPTPEGSRRNLAGHSPPHSSNPGIFRRIFTSSPIPSSSRSDEACAVEAEIPTLAPIHRQAPEPESNVGTGVIVSCIEYRLRNSSGK